jgi:hypothetical protein
MTLERNLISCDQKYGFEGLDALVNNSCNHLVIKRKDKIKMSSTQRIIVLIALDLCFLIFGIHGVVNRKRINKVAHLIISIGQIVSGIILFIGIIILYYAGKL